MCYLVAKNFRKTGSIALKTKHGKELVAFTKNVTELVKGKEIQLVTISRPEAYKEYAPYTLVVNEKEFVDYLVML